MASTATVTPDVLELTSSDLELLELIAEMAEEGERFMLRARTGLQRRLGLPIGSAEYFEELGLDASDLRRPAQQSSGTPGVPPVRQFIYMKHVSVSEDGCPTEYRHLDRVRISTVDRFSFSQLEVESAPTN